jgi:hypothetical protein
MVTQFALPSHGHFQNGNPDEIAVLSHIPLTCKRPGGYIGEEIFWAGLRALTNNAR